MAGEGEHSNRVLWSFHEAGHAVAYAVAGGRVQRLTMEHMIPGAPPADSWGAAVAFVSGAVAARQFGPSVASTLREHSEGDLAAAASALGVARLTRSTLADLERDALAVLLAHDRSVHSVASALREHGELTGADVAALMAGGKVEARPASQSATAPRRHALEPARAAVAVSAAPHRAVAIPVGPHGWPETVAENGVSKVLVGATDLPAVAAAYGLTSEDLADLNELGLPRPGASKWEDGPESCWIHVRPRQL